MKALIEKILITERVRKEITKIDELATDIKINGLLHPITVMSVEGGEFRLLAGLRRLKAVESLGEADIEVKVVSPADAEAALRIEISENEQREPFTLIEKVEFGNMLEVIEKAKAQERMQAGKKIVTSDPLLPGAEGQKGNVRDIVADKVGMGGMSYDRAKYIAKKAPKEIVDEIDAGKRGIRDTYDELKAKEKAKTATKIAESETIEADEESDSDNQMDGGTDSGVLATPIVNTSEKTAKSPEPETIEADEESDGDKQESNCSKSGMAVATTAIAPTVDPPKPKVHHANVLSKADQEAEARNIAFNALSPQKKVVELQRQLKEERARAAHAESELERLKELRHNDVFHKDGIINNLKARLANAEARIKELEDKYCAK